MKISDSGIIIIIIIIISFIGLALQRWIIKPAQNNLKKMKSHTLVQTPKQQTEKKCQIYTGFSTKIKYLNRTVQTVNYLKE